jgi:hypothetical protein
LRQSNRRLVVAFRVARLALQFGENPRALGRVAVVGRIPAVFFVVIAAAVFCSRTVPIVV